MHWNITQLEQAEDRAHRIGQLSTVNCHYLIGKNTLDQKLFKMLERKKEVISTILDGEQIKLNIQNNIEHVQNNSSKITNYLNQNSTRSLALVNDDEEHLFGGDLNEDNNRETSDQARMAIEGQLPDLNSKMGIDQISNQNQNQNSNQNQNQKQSSKDEFIDDIEQILQEIRSDNQDSETSHQPKELHIQEFTHAVSKQGKSRKKQTKSKKVKNVNKSMILNETLDNFVSRKTVKQEKSSIEEYSINFNSCNNRTVMLEEETMQQLLKNKESNSLNISINTFDNVKTQLQSVNKNTTTSKKSSKLKKKIISSDQSSNAQNLIEQVNTGNAGTNVNTSNTGKDGISNNCTSNEKKLSEQERASLYLNTLYEKELKQDSSNRSNNNLNMNELFGQEPNKNSRKQERENGENSNGYMENLKQIEQFFNQYKSKGTLSNKQKSSKKKRKSAKSVTNLPQQQENQQLQKQEAEQLCNKKDQNTIQIQQKDLQQPTACENEEMQIQLKDKIIAPFQSNCNNQGDNLAGNELNQNFASKNDFVSSNNNNDNSSKIIDSDILQLLNSSDLKDDDGDNNNNKNANNGNKGEEQQEHKVKQSEIPPNSKSDDDIPQDILDLLNLNSDDENIQREKQKQIEQQQQQNHFENQIEKIEKKIENKPSDIKMEVEGAINQVKEIEQLKEKKKKKKNTNQLKDKIIPFDDKEEENDESMLKSNTNQQNNSGPLKEKKLIITTKDNQNIHANVNQFVGNIEQNTVKKTIDPNQLEIMKNDDFFDNILTQRRLKLEQDKIKDLEQEASNPERKQSKQNMQPQVQTKTQPITQGQQKEKQIIKNCERTEEIHGQIQQPFFSKLNDEQANSNNIESTLQQIMQQQSLQIQIINNYSTVVNNNLTNIPNQNNNNRNNQSNNANPETKFNNSVPTDNNSRNSNNNRQSNNNTIIKTSTNLGNPQTVDTKISETTKSTLSNPQMQQKSNEKQDKREKQSEDIENSNQIYVSKQISSVIQPDILKLNNDNYFDQMLKLRKEKFTTFKQEIDWQHHFQHYQSPSKQQQILTQQQQCQKQEVQSKQLETQLNQNQLNQQKNQLNQQRNQLHQQERFRHEEQKKQQQISKYNNNCSQLDLKKNEEYEEKDELKNFFTPKKMEIERSISNSQNTIGSINSRNETKASNQSSKSKPAANHAQEGDYNMDLFAGVKFLLFGSNNKKKKNR